MCNSMSICMEMIYCSIAYHLVFYHVNITYFKQSVFKKKMAIEHTLIFIIRTIFKKK